MLITVKWSTTTIDHYEATIDTDDMSDDLRTLLDATARAGNDLAEAIEFDPDAPAEFAEYLCRIEVPHLAGESITTDRSWSDITPTKDQS